MKRNFGLMAFTAATLAVPSFAAGIATIIDNGSVRVVRSIQEPHQKQSWPKQEVDALAVYLQPGTQEITFANGSKSTLRFEPGDVRWMPANGAYSTELTSDSPVTQVVIFITKPESEGGPNVRQFAPSVIDSLKVAADQYSLILENRRVRVMSVKSAPGQTTALHEHAASRAVVYLTDMNAKVIGADGTVTTPSHKAGDVSWNPPAKHIETNLLNSPFEAVVVEVK